MSSVCRLSSVKMSDAYVLVTHAVYRATDEKTEARLASLLRRMAKSNNDQRLIKKVLNISTTITSGVRAQRAYKAIHTHKIIDLRIGILLTIC